MRQFKRICVYCGSSTRVDPAFLDAARRVGEILAGRGLGLVFGGGRVGLMGAVADGALGAGGEVLGVIPDKLRALELGHTGCTELFVVDSMHARKMMMAQLSDAFIALPGGWGTLEELCEVTTWTMLSYHEKPVGMLNVNGYYDHFLAFIEHAIEQQFIRDEHRAIVQSADDPEKLLDALASVDLPKLEKWIDKP